MIEEETVPKVCPLFAKSFPPPLASQTLWWLADAGVAVTFTTSSSTLNIGEIMCTPGVRPAGSPLTLIGPLPLGAFQTYCGPRMMSWNGTPAAIGAELPHGVELT